MLTAKLEKISSVVERIWSVGDVVGWVVMFGVGLKWYRGCALALYGDIEDGGEGEERWVCRVVAVVVVVLYGGGGGCKSKRCG